MKRLILILMLLINSVMWADAISIKTVPDTNAVYYYDTNIKYVLNNTYTSTSGEDGWKSYLFLSPSDSILMESSTSLNDWTNDQKEFTYKVNHVSDLAWLKAWTKDGTRFAISKPFKILYGSIIFDSIPNLINYKQKFYLSWIGHNLPNTLKLKYRLYGTCDTIHPWVEIKTVTPSGNIYNNTENLITNCASSHIEFGIFYTDDTQVNTISGWIHKYTCNDVIKYQDSIIKYNDIIITNQDKNLKEKSELIIKLYNDTLRLYNEIIRLKNLPPDTLRLIVNNDITHVFTQEEYKGNTELNQIMIEEGSIVYVFDLLGNQKLKYGPYMTSTTFNYLDINSLASGTYFISIIKNNRFILYKFSK